MNTEKQTVTFVEPVALVDHNKELEFKAFAGDVIALSPASAERWVKRGKAVMGDHKIPDDLSDQIKKATETVEAAEKRLATAKEGNDAKETKKAEKHLKNKQAELDALKISD